MAPDRGICMLEPDREPAIAAATLLGYAKPIDANEPVLSKRLQRLWNPVSPECGYQRATSTDTVGQPQSNAWNEPGIAAEYFLA